MNNSNKKALIAVFISSFFVAFFAMPQSLLAFMFESFPNVEPATVTLIVTLPTAVSVVVSLVMGVVFGRVGKKTLLLIGLGLYLAETCMICFTNGRSITLMLVAAALGGIAYGMILTTTNAQVASLAAAGKGATMISINTAIGASGTMSFAFLAGILAKDGNWVRAYNMGFSVLAAIIIVFLIAPAMNPSNVEEGEKTAKKTQLTGSQVKWIVFILIFYNLYHMGMCVMSLNYSSYIVSEFALGDAIMAGTAGTALSLGGLLGGFFLTEILRRLFKNYLPVIGMVVMVIILSVTAGVTSSLGLCYVCIFLTGAFSSTSFAGAMAVLTEIVPQKADLSVSLFSATTALAMFLTPYVVNTTGTIVFGDNFVSRYIAAAIYCLIGAVGLFLIIRLHSIRYVP